MEGQVTLIQKLGEDTCDCKNVVIGVQNKFYFDGTTCTPIQEIILKNTCTETISYQYLIEDGSGGFVDASITIVDWDESNVSTVNCMEAVNPNPDHANGCIKRTVTQNVLTCNEQVTTYNFTATDLVSFSILSKDGNGNFTATQEHDAGIHAQILALFQSMTVDNTRMEENIGNGAAIFNFWEGNLSNVIDVSPTLIQFDWHLEPSVSDTPDALIEPCIDPIADSVYQNTASQLTTIYNSVPLNTPINNGGQPITFVVTHYTQISTPNGTTFEYIPAKQVLTYNSAGVPVTDKYYEQWTLNEIPFNPLTDVFSNECGSEVKAIPFQVFCLEKPASTTTEVGLSTTVNAQNSLVGSEQLQFSPYPTSVLPIPTSITVSNDLLNTVPQDAYGVSLSNSSLTVNDLVTKVNFTVTIAQASGDTTDTVQDAIGGGIYDSAGNPIAGTFTVFPAGAVLNGNLGYIALGAGHTVGTAYSFEYTLTNPHAASDLRVFFGFDDLDVGSNQNGIYTINSVYLTYSHVEVTQGERYEVQEIKYSDGTREFRKVSDNSLVTYNSTTDILSYGGCATQTLNTTVSYLEKEVCGTIDGGIQTYELIRVYTRNQNTGLIEISHYEYKDGTVVSGSVTETCNCPCDAICDPNLRLPVNRSCYTYSREGDDSGFISGSVGTTWNGVKSESNTHYDTLLTDNGFASIVGAPRNLRYVLTIADINGDTSKTGAVIDIPVPTANYNQTLASAINNVLGADIFIHDGIGWVIQYNTAWTSLVVLISEYADNHAGGYTDIRYGQSWGIRLNGGVIEDAANVEANNLPDGNWKPLTICNNI